MKSALFDQPNRRQSNLVQREKPGIAHGTHTIVVSSVTPSCKENRRQAWQAQQAQTAEGH